MNKNLLKHLKGAGSTFGNEATFGLLKKIPKVKSTIKEYKKSNPKLHKTAKIAGDLGGSFLPGMAAVKGLSKIKAFKKALNLSRAKGMIGQGAIYGAAPTIAKGVVNKRDPKEVVSDAIASGIAGGAGGLAVGKAAQGIGRALQPKFARKRGIVKGVADRMLEGMGSKDIKHAESIVKNPIKSSHLNLNNLVLRPTDKTKAMTDAIYHSSPSARGQIENLRRKVSEGHIPHINEAVSEAMGGKRPDSAKFSSDFKRSLERHISPLYEKAYSVKHVPVSARVKGNPDFKRHMAKAMGTINDVDRGSPTHSKNSLRMLDKAKRLLQDEESKAVIAGTRERARDLQIPISELRESLGTASPHYKKATALSRRYKQVEEAGEHGKEYIKKSIPETKELLGGFKGAQKRAYRHGMLETMLKGAEKRGANAELGQAGREIVNPQRREYLREAIGPAKEEALHHKVHASNEAVRHLNEISRGSKTAEHASNKRLILDAIGALKGRTRGLINIGGRIAGRSRGLPLDREGKSRMKLLLNPKLLLKLRNKQKKNKNILSPIAAGLMGREE